MEREKIKKELNGSQYNFNSDINGLNSSELIELIGGYKNSAKEDGYIDIEKYLIEIQKMGIGEIKIMFVDREGKGIGLDAEYCKYLSKLIHISCIYEGGVGSLGHLEDAFASGIQAVSLGTMLIFNDYNIVKIKSHLLNKGYNVRL